MKIEYQKLKDQKAALDCTKQLMESKIKEKRMIYKVPSFSDLKTLNVGKGVQEQNTHKPTFAEKFLLEVKLDHSEYEEICRRTESTLIVIKRLATKIKLKKQEITFIEQDLSEALLHWNSLKSQIRALTTQMDEEINNIYKEVTKIISKQSNISIDMYYL